MARWTTQDLVRVGANVRMEARHGISTPITGRVPPRRQRGKYGNQPITVDGHRFDSKLEAKRYGELKLLLLAEAIEDLRIHYPWELHVSGIRVCAYVCDFDYLLEGKRYIEDCKGMLTQIYQLKKKMIAAEYGLDIIEIRA
jgi:Protein of unknown function (DUF1064)